jgi:predicted RNA-binding Zn ribbon-like protein
LRESIYQILLRVMEGRRPRPTDLELVNSELARTLGRLRIAPVTGESRYDWKWAGDQLELDYPLGPLAHSAGQLLSSGHKLAHVRQCRGDNCGWLFVDLSKNHSRCWCDMRDCGNRAKVRRHRQKHRA